MVYLVLVNNCKRLIPVDISSSFEVITNNSFPGFCLRGRESKVPDFKSELLGNDKFDSENVVFILLAIDQNF